MQAHYIAVRWNRNYICMEVERGTRERWTSESIGRLKIVVKVVREWWLCDGVWVCAQHFHENYDRREQWLRKSNGCLLYMAAATRSPHEYVTAAHTKQAQMMLRRCIWSSLVVCVVFLLFLCFPFTFNGIQTAHSRQLLIQRPSLLSMKLNECSGGFDMQAVCVHVRPVVLSSLDVRYYDRNEL